jgi:hypothetical protein
MPWLSSNPICGKASNNELFGSKLEECSKTVRRVAAEAEKWHGMTQLGCEKPCPSLDPRRGHAMAQQQPNVCPGFKQQYPNTKTDHHQQQKNGMLSPYSGLLRANTIF